MKYLDLILLVSCLPALSSGCSKSQSAAPAPQALADSSSTSSSSISLTQVYDQTVVAAANPASGTAGRCVDCHTSTGAESAFPFADPNPQVAFNAGITAMGIINVPSPSSSNLLAYLTNGHCGGAECEVTAGSAVYQTFLAAAQNYALATTTAPTPISPTLASPEPIASPSPTLVPISAVTGTSASPVPFPSNPPLLGATPLLLEIPLTAINAKAGTSSVQLSVAYTVSGVSSAGTTVYLYDISNPVLVNSVRRISITLAGFYLARNGMIDLGNNIFSDASLYFATAASQTSQTLNPTNTLDSISISASPGDSLTLVVRSLTMGQ